MDEDNHAEPETGAITTECSCDLNSERDAGRHEEDSLERSIIESRPEPETARNCAHSKGNLKWNPLAEQKSMDGRDKRVVFWSPEEYEKFACHARNCPDYYCAYEVLYWCGLRLSELLALTLDDVDLEACVIHVTKTYRRVNRQDVITTPKTPSFVRRVSMPAFLRDEIRDYIAMLYEPTGTQRLFALLTKSGLATNFHRLITEAGLKRITVHGLRHSHVSLLISKNYDIFEVSKRIGHNAVKSTQEIYGHLFDEIHTCS